MRLWVLRIVGLVLALIAPVLLLGARATAAGAPVVVNLDCQSEVTVYGAIGTDFEFRFGPTCQPQDGIYNAAFRGADNDGLNPGFLDPISLTGTQTDMWYEYTPGSPVTARLMETTNPSRTLSVGDVIAVTYVNDGSTAAEQSNIIWGGTTAPTYTVTYNANGSTSGTVPSAATGVLGSYVTATNSGSLARTGYTFRGWSTSAGGAPLIGAGSTISVSANTTLYAVWELPRFVTPMLPQGAPTVAVVNSVVTCAMGEHSQAVQAAIYTLTVDGSAVLTSMTNEGWLPIWIAPWAAPKVDTKAKTSSASFAYNSAWRGKKIGCITLAYANNATGMNSAKEIVAP